jgi:hypothetical protein
MEIDFEAGVIRVGGDSEYAEKKYVDAELKKVNDALGEAEDSLAQVDVKLGAKMSMKLLWENASPTSDFSSQTISVSLDGYDSYMIIARFHTSVTLEVAQNARVGNGILLFCNDAEKFYRRNITYSASSLTFSECKYSGYVTNDAYLIPVAIYGTKGVSA